MRSLRRGGQITAVTPRSFQNGTTFAEFRRGLATGADTAEIPEPTTGDDGDETGAPA